MLEHFKLQHQSYLSTDLMGQKLSNNKQYVYSNIT